LDARSERPGLRHELKFVSDEAAYAEIRMALRLDRAGIRILHPPRVVQSLYLDTTFQRALEENLAGLSVREKIRVRWYGTGSAEVECVLEKKCRENTLGWKENVRVPGPLPLAGVARRAFVAELARRSDARWRARLAALEPAQWIRYRREYLESADRRVRLTLDRELFFADQRRLARLSDSERTPSARVLVLELKCAPGDLDRAQGIVENLAIPLGRCSKFVLAATPSSGPLPSQLEV
jgi:VTC domain-containing protein